MTLYAVTRDVSDSFADCEVTFAERDPIDVGLARRQHRAFESTLADLGANVIRVEALPDHPDATFVEDTAVVLPELAVMASPALESRRGEVASVAAMLERYRPRRFLRGPARLEGGDVITVGHTLFVGLSTRTNREGVAQLTQAVSGFGYEVRAVEFRNCLHLKSACTYLGNGTVLANPGWADCNQLGIDRTIYVDPSEASAANALDVNGVLVFPACFPRTQERLKSGGFRVQTVDISELQKADAAVTCSAILFED